MFNLDAIIRENVKRLKPYSSARDEFKGQADVWLDANENPFDSGLNRYPDPLAMEVKKAIDKIKGVNSENIFLGNGSDEAIDLLYRAFCEPCKDKALIMPPTYGMYEVSASINDVEIVKVPLTGEFQIDLVSVKDFLEDKSIKLIFICSPNNPTGNLMSTETIKAITQNFHGLVIVDEAYIDFALNASLIPLLKEVQNLVILQTFSKAWGMAGIRLGMAFASVEIINILNKIKPPYNINTFTQKMALDALIGEDGKDSAVTVILREREILVSKLGELPNVKRIYPSDANFILVEFTDPNVVYNSLVEKGIIVRNRHSVVNGCLRITIGTPEENERLIEVLS